MPLYNDVIIFKDTVEGVKNLLRRSSKDSNYIKVGLNEEQKKWLYDVVVSKSFLYCRLLPKQNSKYKNLVPLKIYSIIKTSNEYTYIIPAHNSGRLKDYCGEEAAEISKDTKNEMLYHWWEEYTAGYEVFKEGKVIKHVVYEPQGCKYEVNGKTFAYPKNHDELPAPFILLSQNIFGSDIFDYLESDEFTFETNPNNESIIFLRKDITDFYEYKRLVEEKIRQNSERFKLFLIILTIVGIVLGVFFIGHFIKK